ncbi:unnamed protein product [Miscanthus lutarioriparius]|uniref:Uncharacterized protein n=1 Tax=Miscanthus lutarioriparius TaxID=422564 RepID=A0A811MHP3_9POAL|nr:unnamed protein product [Miscanthus lutarioriparius]
MAAPVEVGAQGTVGSLVLREVEYFRRMEVAAGGHGKKSSSKVVAASGGGGGSNSKKPKKKKDAVAGNGGSFLPRMCSSAEVAEDHGSGRRERPSRVRYRPLGDDGDALPQLD